MTIIDGFVPPLGSNAEAFHIGCLAADGLSPEAIAAALGRGGDAERIAAMVEASGYVHTLYRLDFEPVKVLLAGRDRTKIGHEANRRGVYLPELAGMVLSAAVRDELFAAVLD